MVSFISDNLVSRHATEEESAWCEGDASLIFNRVQVQKDFGLVTDGLTN